MLRGTHFLDISRYMSRSLRSVRLAATPLATMILQVIQNEKEYHSNLLTKSLMAVLAVGLTTAPVQAMEFDVHGFVMGTVSKRVNSVPLQSGKKNNWLLGEERVRLGITGESEEGTFGMVSKADFVSDHVAGEASVDLRELYVEYLADDFELRAGRQMLTWGVADRLFINDVFPKDWSAFFSGQPLEYMKIGSDMAKLFVFGSGWDMELAAIPVAQFDVTPGTDRFVVYSPIPLITEPRKRAANSELAMRFHTKVGESTDLALYAFKGFWHQPDKGVAGNSIIYPRLNNYGFTLQDTVMGGVLSFEAGFYQSVDDRDGTDPFIANSQYRYLIGYEHELMTDVTLALQWYGEVMQNHSAYQAAAQPAFVAGMGPKPLPKHRKIMTANLRALWMNQTLTTSLFFMGVGDGGGRMANPDVHYAINDTMSINAGAHVFWGGPDTWMLGTMKNDDNVYMNVKWTF